MDTISINIPIRITHYWPNSPFFYWFKRGCCPHNLDSYTCQIYCPLFPRPVRSWVCLVLGTPHTLEGLFKLFVACSAIARAWRAPSKTTSVAAQIMHISIICLYLIWPNTHSNICQQTADNLPGRTKFVCVQPYFSTHRSASRRPLFMMSDCGPNCPDVMPINFAQFF